MNEFVCRIASREDLLKRWEYLIEVEAGDTAWLGYREFALRNFDDGSAVTYLGILDGEIICEATAYIRSSAFAGDISDPSGLLRDGMAYLAAFRTNKPFEGRGYFGRLYRYVEADLKQRGYTELCLGVGPEAVRNMEIYFHLGYREYVKTLIEPLPQGEEVILFYRKRIEGTTGERHERYSHTDRR